MAAHGSAPLLPRHGLAGAAAVRPTAALRVPCIVTANSHRGLHPTLAFCAFELMPSAWPHSWPHLLCKCIGQRGHTCISCVPTSPVSYLYMLPMHAHTYAGANILHASLSLTCCAFSLPKATHMWSCSTVYPSLVYGMPAGQSLSQGSLSWSSRNPHSKWSGLLQGPSNWACSQPAEQLQRSIRNSLIRLRVPVGGASIGLPLGHVRGPQGCYHGPCTLASCPKAR